MPPKPYRKAPFITLMGPDGVGKTTYLEYMETHPDTLGVKGVMTILRKIPSETDTADKVNPIHLPPHNWLKSIVKLIFRFIEWQNEYLFGDVARARSQGYIVAFDRYYFLDMFIDPLRYRYAGPSWLLQLALKLVPDPDLTFLLDAPAEILHSRKQENSIEYLEHWRQVYRAVLLPRPNTYLVDVSGSMEEAFEQIRKIILEYMSN
jgi:thymidylate kinase